MRRPKPLEVEGFASKDSIPSSCRVRVLLTRACERKIDPSTAIQTYSDASRPSASTASISAPRSASKVRKTITETPASRSIFAAVFISVPLPWLHEALTCTVIFRSAADTAK